ncbi:DUF4392 domain-containing protein [Chloroflexota bacterium]
MSAIEEIILRNDRRGVSALKSYLADDFCTQAAQHILDNPGSSIVCTGFYIRSAGAPETDGPPGAVFIGRALESLDYSVTHVCDRYSSQALKGSVPADRIIEFPIADEPSSQQYAHALLEELKPSVLVSIERGGMTRDGRYLNMRGVDFSQYNAKLDYLFTGHAATVGIGDGGNEIGMGNLAQEIPQFDTLPDDPAVTCVDKLVIASVSNWGGYGLIAALSLLVGKNLLPSVQEEEDMICRMVDAGAVDGVSGNKIYAVDAFPLSENRQSLEALHAVLLKHGL